MKLENFGEWVSFSKLCLANISDVHEHGCVYMFRTIGDNLILYIGETGNIRQRLYRNYIGGVGGSTTQRIHNILFQDDNYKKVEISWKETKSRKADESRLLVEYTRRYGQLPLWNKRG